ncbi:MAG: RING finger domain-containing protein [Sweet potato little leaf phytoplasma]|nr:RING finger domain-containing protein [Sweet potato little leaf phytoplasma]
MFGKVLPLTITIKLWNFAVFFESQLSAMTESEYGMVPTNRRAMEEMVKRVKCEDIEDDQSCVICLEKIEREEKIGILQMPCLHLFHENCINKWLRNSHYCPICRFEMPTN